MKNYLTILIAVFSIQLVFGQHNHTFTEPDMMLNENLKKEHPELADDITKAEEELEKFTAEFIQNNQNIASRAADYDYIIPVVFHILHQDGPENITNKEVHDAMRILNEDFKLENADQANTVQAFKGIMGDARIEFRLARKDPNGNPTTGIDRINTPLTENAGENSKLNVWPRDTYMNIWIVKSIASGAAGYTFLPSGAHRMPARDGIILLYNYFSSIRTGNSRRSRALTHEVGHWLNLPHPWGGTNNPGVSQNCSDDDGVGDTPNTEGWTSCNLNGTTCGSLDNVQNHMDYSYCSTMFTKGQVARMQAAVNSRIANRDDLVSKTNNEKAGVLDLDEVAIESDKRVVCTGTEIAFKDATIYGGTTWNWKFEGGTPSTSTSKNPVIKYNKMGSYKVTLTVSNGVDTKTKEFMQYVVVNRSVGNFLPFEDDFEDEKDVINGDWTPENEDNDLVFWKKMQGTGASGTGYLGILNYTNMAGMIEGVISPAYDLSNIFDAEIRFDVATADRDASVTGNNGILTMKVSADCGNTWSARYSTSLDFLADGKVQSGSFFPSSTSDWKAVSIRNFLPADLVDNLLIKFEIENSNGNNVFIDNINFFGSFSDTPVLEFPENNMDSVSSSVHLDWKSVPYADSYECEIATDNRFSNVVATITNQYIDENPNGNDTRFLVENLQNNTTHYWRVRMNRGSVTSDWSDVWEFTTSSDGVGHEFLDGEELTTGFDEVEKTKTTSIKVFPNPTAGELNILVLNSDNAQVLMVNLYGAEVLNQRLSEPNGITTLNVEELPAGFYMVNVTTNGKTTSNKILIQK